MEIHPAFESKIRILIVGALINGSKNFTELKECVKATDGNLITHLARLQESDFVQCEKIRKNNKQLSLYTLTPAGRAEFSSFVDSLNELLSKPKRPKAVQPEKHHTPKPMEPEPEEAFESEEELTADLVAQNVTLSDDEIWL